MIQMKICMLGAYAVGKTSLVSRYVHSLYSDKYLTTVGVKVDKKQLAVDGQDVTLMLWDIYGQDDYQKVTPAQLRGMAGYLLVVDGTRLGTLDTARQLQEKVTTSIGALPFLLILNKYDLAPQWEVDESALWKLAEQGWHIVRTSAKTGEGVEQAFESLSRTMLQQRRDAREDAL
jgi:small GTP-binding protein